MPSPPNVQREAILLRNRKCVCGGKLVLPCLVKIETNVMDTSGQEEFCLLITCQLCDWKRTLQNYLSVDINYEN